MDGMGWEVHSQPLCFPLYFFCCTPCRHGHTHKHEPIIAVRTSLFGRRRRRRSAGARETRGGEVHSSQPPHPPPPFFFSLSLSLSSRLHSGASGEGLPTLVLCINRLFYLSQLSGLPPHTHMPPAPARAITQTAHAMSGTTLPAPAHHARQRARRHPAADRPALGQRRVGGERARGERACRRESPPSAWHERAAGGAG